MIRIPLAGIAILAFAGLAQAQDFRLGPAPRHDPSLPVPLAPAVPVAKAVSSVPAIDTSNRAAVIAAFNTFFNVAQPAVGFTGSTATCTPGSISLAFQEWTVTRINFLRAMAGVPGNTTLDSTLNGQEQAAALIMARNNLLDHDPSPALPCYTPLGDAGAGSSNLALGGGLTDALPLYMTDPGTGNELIGHRRWILHTQKAKFGVGQANGPVSNANALYAFDFGAPAIAQASGIPWPPRGYVPLALFPAPAAIGFGGEGPRWSFGLPNANFGTATVTMTLNGVALPVTIISRSPPDDGFGDNTLVWSLPVGHTVVKDTTYTVTITGITGVATSSYSYVVQPINPADAQSAWPRLGNISTRMQVLTGSDVLIGGFVIEGTASKQVAIVATGPSLVAFGIPNALVDPTLTLVRQSDQAVLATNDNWPTAPNVVALTASGFAPSNPLESAILMALPPGAYTAIVSGVGGGTGVGIVAVYEVDHIDMPLVNISTRGQVLTGNDVMIGGFVVQGTGAQTVAIVATGPSLAAFGIANPLANPTLTLVRSSDQAVLATNDNWQAGPSAAQLQGLGLAPTNPLESGILVTLQPGAYTAILSGVSGGTGVGIIGVYTLP